MPLNLKIFVEYVLGFIFALVLCSCADAGSLPPPEKMINLNLPDEPFKSNAAFKDCHRVIWVDKTGKETAESRTVNNGQIFSCYGKDGSTFFFDESQMKVFFHNAEYPLLGRVYGLACKDMVAVTYGSDAHNKYGHYFTNFIFDRNWSRLKTFTSYDFSYESCSEMADYVRDH